MILLWKHAGKGKPLKPWGGEPARAQAQSVAQRANRATAPAAARTAEPATTNLFAPESGCSPGADVALGSAVMADAIEDAADAAEVFASEALDAADDDAAEVSEAVAVLLLLLLSPPICEA